MIFLFYFIISCELLPKKECNTLTRPYARVS